MSASSSQPMVGHHAAGGDDGHDLSKPWVIERLSNFKLTHWAEKFSYLLLAIGALTVLAGLVLNPPLFWASLLLVSFMLISLALAGAFMMAAQYLTSAGWSIVLRRISEGFIALLIPGLIGIAAVMLFRPSLYPWIAEAAAGHGLEGFKGFWLDHANWLIRAAIYATIWIVFSFALRRNSRLQDRDGKLVYTRRNVVLSALFIITFALSYWLASVDWLMSLEPHWFSTMYGVYNFSGLMTTGVAVTIIVAVVLRNQGALKGFVSDDHLHDLGKMLLTFTTFWAYIWFSEYMLIWYANIPEEAEHFVVRTQGLWLPLFYLNVALNWVIPFLALLPRAGKRDGSFLVKIAGVVLLGRFLDMYLLIIPTVSPETPFAGFAPLGMMVAAIGLFILVFGRALGQASLLPLKDPYLDESLHHHV